MTLASGLQEADPISWGTVAAHTVESQTRIIPPSCVAELRPVPERGRALRVTLVRKCWVDGSLG